MQGGRQEMERDEAEELRWKLTNPTALNASGEFKFSSAGDMETTASIHNSISEQPRKLTEMELIFA